MARRKYYRAARSSGMSRRKSASVARKGNRAVKSRRRKRK